MGERVLVNPEILRWARETSGLGVEDVSSKMKKDVDTVLAWESGEKLPTYVQLETLAYQLYKRPIALFFFPEPPEEKSLKQSFRTVPEYKISQMSPRLWYLVRQARVMQINLAELFGNINSAKRQIIHELHFTLNDFPVEMALATRKYLEVDFPNQPSFNNATEAFKYWRNLLEEHGVFVFKEAFKENDSAGFCLYDTCFPVIYINNSNPYTRQIFTLFHELAHLLFGLGGVDFRDDRYVEQLMGDDRKIEILCNQFVSAFLVPDTDFNQKIERIIIDNEAIEDLAGQYCVSREVILRKFLDRNMISKAYYMEKVRQWNVSTKKTGSGGDYYLTKGTYLGERYIGAAFSQHYQNKISLEQLADYLGVKTRNVPGMESLLFKKEAVV